VAQPDSHPRPGKQAADSFWLILVGPRQAAWHHRLASVSNPREASWVGFPARKQALTLDATTTRHSPPESPASAEGKSRLWLENRARKPSHKPAQGHGISANDSGAPASCGSTTINHGQVLGTLRRLIEEMCRRAGSALLIKQSGGSGGETHRGSVHSDESNWPTLSATLPSRAIPNVRRCTFLPEMNVGHGLVRSGRTSNNLPAYFAADTISN
jgi:hypothetical protein